MREARVRIQALEKRMSDKKLSPEYEKLIRTMLYGKLDGETMKEVNRDGARESIAKIRDTVERLRQMTRRRSRPQWILVTSRSRGLGLGDLGGGRLGR